MLVALTLITAARAQSQASAGSIEGTVTDTHGAVVPDAKVTARNLQTGLTRDATSNSEGLYRLLVLPVGEYDVTIEKQGFAAIRHQAVKVQVGEKLTLDVQLGAAGAAESVNVTAEAPIVETTRTQVSATVNDRAVANLPTNGRNFIDFVLLTPGVVLDRSRTGDISFAGQRGTLNSLQIDGADNNNTFFGQALGRTGSGRAPYQFSQDAVQEFQVNSNSYTAEFGRAGGAVINVVTKSGTNAFHGTAFEFYRDKALNANTFFNNAAGRRADGSLIRPVPPLHAHQFGGNIGGRIVKDKAFFFFDYDDQRRRDPIDVLLGGTRVGPSDPNFAAQQAALAEIATHGVSYNRLFDQKVYLLKGDWQITKSNHFTARWNHQDFVGGALENSAPVGIFTTQSTFEHTGNSNVKTDTLTFSLASVLTNSVINEFRFQYARDGEPGTANSDTPELSINQGGLVALLGRNNFSPRETTENRYQYIDNVSYTRGKHGLKTGVDVNVENILNFFPGFFGGQYFFNSLADFANRKPLRFTQSFAGAGTDGPTTHPNIREFSSFVQDDWRVSPRLTFNVGLRYDLQKMKKPTISNPDAALLAAGINTGQLKTDKNNFAPRLGFAWNPLASNKLVVRGGYGIYFGRTPAIMLATATSNNGLQVISVTFTGSAMPTFPNRFSSLPTGGTAAAANIFFFAPDYVSPYTQQWSLGVEHQLFKDMSVTISYLGVKGTHLQRTRDVNLLPPVPISIQDDTGRGFTFLRFPGRRFANFGRISEFESTANSIYNGLTVQVNKRFAKGFQLLGAFTYSKAIDDNPDATAVVPFSSGDELKIVQNTLNPRDDRGLSLNDVRKRLVISGIWDLSPYIKAVDNPALRTLLSGWSLSGIFTAEDGRPFTAKVGGDLNNDSNSRTDRVPSVGRNTLIGPGFVSLDPRVTREITFYERVRLQLIFEAFNVFNRTNFTNFSDIRETQYNITGTFPNQKLVTAAGFGTSTGTFNPRQLQLAAKIIF
jgi:hypothetical protein